MRTGPLSKDFCLDCGRAYSHCNCPSDIEPMSLDEWVPCDNKIPPFEPLPGTKSRAVKTCGVCNFENESSQVICIQCHNILDSSFFAPKAYPYLGDTEVQLKHREYISQLDGSRTIIETFERIITERK